MLFHFFEDCPYYEEMLEIGCTKETLITNNKTCQDSLNFWIANRPDDYQNISDTVRVSPDHFKGQPYGCFMYTNSKNHQDEENGVWFNPKENEGNNRSTVASNIPAMTSPSSRESPFRLICKCKGTISRDLTFKE